ncbi:hypothetical protein WN48_11299 [Eufriesea mexicana]|uniref:Uncharacterized protein n=1 Tax=Eufriesea mexicana TaxID=516756 RepID=A0A310SQA6_9HYME|nr:hypothetical protein WN48_11299 [Eufriesea mexicana]
MDDEEYLQPVLTSQEEEHFQTLNTIPIVSVSLIFGVCLEITGIIFISLWPEEKNKCDTYFIYLYLHCAYWLIVMLTDHLVKAKHRKVSKFNRLHPPADVAREEWRSSFTQNSFAGGSEVGYYQRGYNVEELLEKQADLIRCLIDHNVQLNQVVMLLTMRNRILQASR